MGIFKPGRPRRATYYTVNSVPLKATGEYRIRDEHGDVLYVGITNMLQRRAIEHQKTGKFQQNYKFDYLPIKRGVTYEQLRIHEKSSIAKYNPYLNQNVGGGGKEPFQIFDDYYPDVEIHDEREDLGLGRRILGKLIRFVKWIIKTAIILAIIGAIIFFAWSYL